MLENKTIVLGVTGSIAAYKAAYLARLFIKDGYDTNVILTKNGSEFITPLTFEALTGRKCITDTFDRNFSFDIEHISLAKKADLFIVAPASANIIGKIANGIADDMLSTTIMAANCTKIIVPAMNTNMYKNQIVQDNLKKLKEYGYKIIEPSTGVLACKDIGEGKLPEPDVIYKHAVIELYKNKDMLGKKVLVTAGATQEAIDPVRYITNHSTGKMGYSIAEICMLRGASVTLISGQTNIEPPLFVDLIKITSAEDMFNEVKKYSHDADFIFKCAAVADYTPLEKSDEKIKKSENDMEIKLKRTNDILKYIGENKTKKQVICGFSMETENLFENSKNKLSKKNADMIIANSLKDEGAGFGTDTNIITIITNTEEKKFPKMTKKDAANKIIDEALKIAVLKNGDDI